MSPWLSKTKIEIELKTTFYVLEGEKQLQYDYNLLHFWGSFYIYKCWHTTGYWPHNGNPRTQQHLLLQLSLLQDEPEWVHFFPLFAPISQFHLAMFPQCNLSIFDLDELLSKGKKWTWTCKCTSIQKNILLCCQKISCLIGAINFGFGQALLCSRSWRNVVTDYNFEEMKANSCNY